MSFIAKTNNLIFDFLDNNILCGIEKQVSYASSDSFKLIFLVLDKYLIIDFESKYFFFESGLTFVIMKKL